MQNKIKLKLTLYKHDGSFFAQRFYCKIEERSGSFEGRGSYDPGFARRRQIYVRTSPIEAWRKT